MPALALVRELYEYHHWANRRLLDVAAGLGPGADREMGSQFSVPTVRGMLTHIYGADAIWLARWQGESPAAIPGADVRSLQDLRQRWDRLEGEQRAFLAGLVPAGLARVIDYRAANGRAFRLPLGPLLQHVANHATHHRSEVATMITMIAGSPPDTGIVTYQLLRSGQLAG